MKKILILMSLLFCITIISSEVVHCTEMSMFSTLGGPKNSTKKDVINAFTTIPEGMRQIIKEDGWKFVYSGIPLSELYPNAKMESSWFACTDSTLKTVFIADSDPCVNTRTTYHEAMHCVNQHFNMISYSDEFTYCYAMEGKTVSLLASVFNQSEWLSECFVMWMEDKKLFEKEYPLSYEWTNKFILATDTYISMQKQDK